MPFAVARQKESFKSLLVRWLFCAAAVWISSLIVPGIRVDDAGSLALAVLVLSLMATFLKPLLVLFALPFVLLTLGLGLWLINALLFWTAGQVLPGFHVEGFLAALLGALLVSIGGAFASLFTVGARIRVQTRGFGGGAGGPAGPVPGPAAGQGSRLPGRPSDPDVIDVESRPG